MVGILPPELTKLRSSSGLTLYPFSNAEEKHRYSPLLYSLQQKAGPSPSRTDIHAVLNHALSQETPHEELRFLDKLRHWIIIQEAFAYDKSRPFHPIPNHVILERITDFETKKYYPIKNDEQIVFHKVQEALKLNTDPSGMTFKDDNDPRGAIQKIVEQVSDQYQIDKKSAFRSSLLEFAQGMVFTLYPDLFLEKLEKYATDESLLPNERLVFNEFRITQEQKKDKFFYLFELLQDLNTFPLLANKAIVLQKIKRLIWKAKNELYGTKYSGSAGERVENHNIWKADRRKALQEKDDLLEDWDFELGDYSSINLLNYTPQEFEAKTYRDLEKKDPLNRPGYAESFIAHRIRNELARQPNQPVILIDFGSMLGASILRIADLFRKEVEEGRIYFIATNIAADADKIDALWKRDAPDKYLWYKERSDLVHFIAEDAQELQNYEIKTKTGTIPFKGNVSLIHEFGAISRHGNLNDIDYPLLANLLTQDGLLMTGRSDPSRLPIDSSAINREENKKQKAHLLPMNEATKKRIKEKWDLSGNLIMHEDYMFANRAQIAYENLHSMGFKVVDAIYDLNNVIRNTKYAFWYKPDSTPLEIQNFDGRWQQIPNSWMK